MATERQEPSRGFVYEPARPPTVPPGVAIADRRRNGTPPGAPE